MLPPFAPNGLLPPTSSGAPHPCSAEEVRDRFVVDQRAPAWRVRLFEGWNRLRLIVADFNPATTWWLWGRFVSAHDNPLFGERETMSAAALLPVGSMPAEDHRVAALLSLLQSAEENFRVDVEKVFEYPADHPDHLLTIGALEYRIRPRACVGIADDATKLLVPTGFVEVKP